MGIVFYRIELTNGHTLEFYISDSNEVNPHKDIKEVGINIFTSDGGQIDGSLDSVELDLLIKYLKLCKNHASDFLEKVDKRRENKLSRETLNKPLIPVAQKVSLDEFIESYNLRVINTEGDFIIAKSILKKMLAKYTKTIGNE